MIVDGKNNKEISLNLSLSEGRIKNVITEILSKLNLKNRNQLIVFAYRNKLII
jgi:DNA-binding NarL/FixJ family response regulator